MGLFDTVRPFGPRNLDNLESPLRRAYPGVTPGDGDGHAGRRAKQCSSSGESLKPLQQMQDEPLSSSVARGSLRRSIDLPRRNDRSSIDGRAGVARPNRKSLDSSVSSPRRKALLNLPPLNNRGRINESSHVDVSRSMPQLSSTNAVVAPKRRSMEEVRSSFKLPEDSRSAASFSHSKQPLSFEQLQLRSSWNSHQDLLQKGPKHKGDGLRAVSQESAMDSLAGAPARALPARKSIDLGQVKRHSGNRVPEILPNKSVLNRAFPSDLPSPSSSSRISFKGIDGSRDNSEAGCDNAFANVPSLHSLVSLDLVSEISDCCSESDDTDLMRPAKAVSFIDPRQNALEFEDAMATLFNLTPRTKDTERFEAEVIRLQAKEDMEELTRRQDELSEEKAQHTPREMLASVSEVSMFAAKMNRLLSRHKTRRVRAEQQEPPEEGPHQQQQKQRKSLEMDQAGIDAAKAQITFERQLEAVFVSFALCGKWDPERMMVQEDPFKGMGILKFVALCSQAGILDDGIITSRTLREMFSCHARHATRLMGFEEFVFALLELAKMNRWTEDRMLQSVAKINREGHIYIHRAEMVASSVMTKPHRG